MSSIIFKTKEFKHIIRISKQENPSKTFSNEQDNNNLRMIYIYRAIYQYNMFRDFFIIDGTKFDETLLISIVM